MGETLADETAEGGVVAGPAADDHRDLVIGRAAHHSARHPKHEVRVGGGEAFEEFLWERGRVVEQTCHRRLSALRARGGVRVRRGPDRVVSVS